MGQTPADQETDEEDKELDDQQNNNIPGASKNIDNLNDQLNNRIKLQKKRQKKNKQLNDIVFGGMSKPFRPLSAHPFITMDLVSGSQRLCPPQETVYKQMTVRYE